jgi:hypothetical protein
MPPRRPFVTDTDSTHTKVTLPENYPALSFFLFVQATRFVTMKR